MKLRLRKPSNANKLKTRFAGSQPVRVAGSRPQGPVGQVSRGLGGPGPQGLGPGPPGAWATTQTSQIPIRRKPPGGSLAKAWVSAETAASEVGTWRETKPGYPPPPPTPSNTPFKVGGLPFPLVDPPPSNSNYRG